MVSPPTIVKLGGSHAYSPRLRDWLEAIACRAGAVVLVAGGGPFADGVRAAQPRMGFDERAAHKMALLAMEQFGQALIGLDDRLSPADSEGTIRRIVADQRVPVWMPSRMVAAATDIPESWDVTSDSLAAWLALRLGAERLVLIKSLAVEEPIDLAALSARGIVDAALPGILADSKIEVTILGPDPTDFDRNTSTAGTPERARVIADTATGLPGCAPA
jgi:5-(aminomethyl)-3-furanmethanol phosphate kinase